MKRINYKEMLTALVGPNLHMIHHRVTAVISPKLINPTP